MRDATPKLSITPYERRYKHMVRDLLFRSYRAHTHLDWHETDEWLNHEDYPIFLAWSNRRIIGVLATGQPLNGAAWLRIAGVSDQADANIVLESLWRNLSRYLMLRGVHTLALLMIRDWIKPYVESLGFVYQEDVVTFRRPPLPIPVVALPSEFSIRPAYAEDIPALARVDNAAFPPPWQMDESEIGQAQRISAICTLAQRGETVIGYQLSTLYFDGSHLARLAVDPAVQGQGIARALLSDVLDRFEQRGIRSMSVNTQATNTRSQRLYVGYGFERNGYDLPVYTCRLTS